MEAKVLKKKKTTISKGQIKKTIKNVICKPDPIFWPSITEEEGKQLEAVLIKYQVEIPPFKKLHWNEIKNMPKNERPKAPPVKKAEGFIFGISECRNLLEKNQVGSVVLENGINPRTIVQPLLDLCNKNKVPVVCLADLRKFSITNFGISTSCLGVKNSNMYSLTDLTNKIEQISSHYKQFNNKNLHQISIEKYEENKNFNDFEMKNTTDDEKDLSDIASTASCYTYLYRKDKKRVFVPTNIDNANSVKTQYIGQNFIKLPTEPDKVSNKPYMKMMIKRISNNPNRAKKKN